MDDFGVVWGYFGSTFTPKNRFFSVKNTKNAIIRGSKHFSRKLKCATMPCLE